MQLREILEQVEKIPGWFYPDQMEFLYPYAQKARNIFEIGTYAGKSTLFWALCNPEASIVTTDTCIGVPSNGITGLSILPCVVGVGKIIALKEDSHELVKRYNQPIDLIFVDGGHKYADVCQDITDWLPKVKGIMVVHDYMDVWPEIKQACDNCLRGKYELLTDQFGLFAVSI
jgi:predicted O-methyltransferase YrrM